VHMAYAVAGQSEFESKDYHPQVQGGVILYHSML
jgi:hypothetical protein